MKVKIKYSMYLLLSIIIIICHSSKPKPKMSGLYFNPKIDNYYNYNVLSEKKIVPNIANDTISITTTTETALMFKLNEHKNSNFFFDAVINSYDIKHIVGPKQIDDSLNMPNESNSFTVNLGGSSFKLTVSDVGKVIDLEGYDSIKNILMESYKIQTGNETENSKIIDDTYPKDYFISIFNDCLYWLPKGAVEPGDQWSNQISIDFAEPIVIDAQFSYEEVLDGRALVKVAAKVIMENGIYKGSDINLEGLVKLDINSGMLSEGKIAVVINNVFNPVDNRFKYDVKYNKTIKLVKAF